MSSLDQGGGDLEVELQFHHQAHKPDISTTQRGSLAAL